MSVSFENGCRDLLVRALSISPKFITELRICELGDQMIRRHGKYVMPVKECLEFVGASYTSIDLNGKHGSVKYDLRDPLPIYSIGRFDIVTNFGTSEHIDEQLPVFENIHELCAKNGVMVHAVPCFAPDHAIWGYTADWFNVLSKEQGYSTISVERFLRPPEMLENPKDGYIHAIFIKPHEKPFRRDSFVDPIPVHPELCQLSR
jgi:hypothetical protein